MYLVGEKDCMKSLNIFITDPLSGLDRLYFSCFEGVGFSRQVY